MRKFIGGGSSNVGNGCGDVGCKDPDHGWRAIPNGDGVSDKPGI